jgi:hypothetical protein
MTPKEKAKSLVDKMYFVISNNGQFTGVHSIPNKFIEAKQCALIAVDEMLNNAGFIWGGRDTETGLGVRDSYRKYLQEVKKEIEAL